MLSRSQDLQMSPNCNEQKAEIGKMYNGFKQSIIQLVLDFPILEQCPPAIQYCGTRLGQLMEMFTFVYFCLLLYKVKPVNAKLVYFCLLLFTFVYFCLLLFTFVYFCLLLFYFCFTFVQGTS
jgi:hypothetical protein